MKVLWGDPALRPQPHDHVRVLYIELHFGGPDTGQHIGWKLELEVRRTLVGDSLMLSVLALVWG